MRIWILTRPWSLLPAYLWVVVASPLLRWSLGRGSWFMWPVGASHSPLRRSFWRVDWGD